VTTAVGHEVKYREFLRMCEAAKANEINCIWVDHPEVLGDNYAEITENLRRVAETGALLKIGAAA